jgi:5-methylcytosine-specific restriction endonuclease McrA
MCNSAAHNSRPNRESVRKQIGVVAARLIAKRDGDACVYCGATAASSGAKLHLDHLTARALGGTNALTNLVTACHSCNSRKQALTLAQWARVASTKMTFTAASIRAHARRLPAAA